MRRDKLGEVLKGSARFRFGCLCQTHLTLMVAALLREQCVRSRDFCTNVLWREDLFPDAL